MGTWREALKNNYFIAAVLLLTVVACYANSLHNDFLWDDVRLIVENDNLHDPSKNINFIRDFWWLDEANKGSPYFRPLISIEYIIDYNIWGLNPFGYHLTNVLLLAAVVIAVFFLTNVLVGDRNISLFAALLFAVHPIHTENVTWIAGRTDVTAALFYFWSVYCYIYFRKQEQKKYLWYAWGLGLLALLAKEVAVTLPLVFVLYDWCFVHKNISQCFKQWKHYVLCATIVPIYAVLRYIALDLNNNFIFMGNIARDFALGSFITPVLKVFYSIALYIYLLFAPVILRIRWEIADIELVSKEAFFAIIVCGAFTYAFIKAAKRKGVSFFLLGFFLLNILLVCNIFSVRDAFAERFVFIASFAWCVLIPLFLFKKIKNHRAVVCVLVLVLIVFGVRTHIRNMDWKNQDILTAKEIQLNPLSAEANYLRGALLHRNGFEEQALPFIEKAIRLDDTRTDAHLHLGVAAYRNGDYDKAFEHLEKCKFYGPPEYLWKAQLHEGVMFMQIAAQQKENGEHEAARKSYISAIDNFRGLLSTKYYIGEFHRFLGEAYALIGDYKNARFELEWALRIDPDDAHAQEILSGLPS